MANQTLNDQLLSAAAKLTDVDAAMKEATVTLKENLGEAKKKVEDETVAVGTTPVSEPTISAPTL